MDKLFDSYWVLRVTALVLAILLFFYVKASLDDTTNTPSNTQMDVITDVPLEAYYDTDNLIVTGLPETVNVTIEGPTQFVLKAKLTKDFKVFVDLSTLLLGEHRVEIKHENFSEKLDVTIDPKHVDIVLEEKITEEVRVDPEMNKGLIADGYELTGMTAEPKTVLVTGAKSIVESINYVKATVTQEAGINKSFGQKANVKVLDKNLNKLEVIIEPESVNVEVGIREYRREIPISIRQTGRALEGVTVNSVTPNQSYVEVYGPKSIIDALTELVVEFDISRVEKTGNFNVKLPIPNGATKLSAETVEVRANITSKKAEANEDNETDSPDDNTAEPEPEPETNTQTDKEDATADENTVEQ